MIMMVLFSPPHVPTLSSYPSPQLHPTFLLPSRRRNLSLLFRSSTNNGSGVVSSTTVEEEKIEERKKVDKSPTSPLEKSLGSNGAARHAEAPVSKDPRWVGGTWDLKQFQKGGRTDWDSVINAEARRRKWLQDNPESTSNDEPIVFDTSIIPWWAWMKRFHLPEAELLNGRAAMIGFFMAYLVDSLTGVGLVDQMGNFFCKTLLFVAVVGVLLIRKTEDIENLKRFLEETTIYDKQWQATWQDGTPNDSEKK